MITVALASIIVALQVSGGQAAAPISGPPVVAFHGNTAAFKGTHVDLIRDEKAWIRWWTDKQGNGREPWGADSPPKVDFKQYMAVAVTEGPGWNGWGFDCVEVVTGGGTMTVRFNRLSYQTLGPDGGGERCNAWGIAVVPRLLPNQLHPHPTVTVEQNLQHIIGDGPIWKKTAEFHVSDP